MPTAAETLEDVLRHGRDRWFQKFEALPGLWTNGDSDMAWLSRRVELPARMDGLRVLDVGTNDGYMAFESEARGAAEVVAVDHPSSWGYGAFSAPHVDKRSRFELVRAARGSAVRAVPCDVEGDSFGPTLLGTFDLVLFLGVLYHLENPVAVFRRLAALTRPGGRLIVETHVDLLDVARPAAAFYPADGPAKVSWWGPNRAMVVGLLRAHGFAAVREIPPEPGATRLAFHAVRGE